MFDISIANIIVTAIISLIGAGYIIHGKQKSEAMFVISGIIMNLYVYFVDNIFISIGIGIVLGIIPFFIDF